MKLLRTVSLIAALSTAAISQAAVKLPPIISDHMVIQREVAAPIWGKAAPGEEVSVSIAGQTKTTKAGVDGKWQVKLDPLKVAEGLTLTVKGSNTLEVKDVLVGEVWLGSGQSNMAGPMRTFKGADEGLQKTLAAAPYPRIRLIKQGASGWMEATQVNVDAFSAILFAFGSRLHAEVGVPVGLVSGAVGGTPSGFWLTEEMYRGYAACMAQAKEFAKTYDFANAMKGYERYMTAWKANAEKAKQTGAPVGREPTAPKQAGECIGEIGHLYTSYVLPYVPYAIRGVLWDQGEGGTGITGADQFHIMGALIKGWRKAWGQDIPFLYMQKPSGGGTAWDLAYPTTKNASPFTELPVKIPADNEGIAREVHIKIQQHPNTSMVISTDLGGMTHPTNKSGYADRALLVSKGFVYGRKVEFSGPLYASHELVGDKVRIRFTHIGRGLATRHSDKLQASSSPVPTKGSSGPMPSSKATQSSSSANLFNMDGLPAQTFRTDDWETDSRAARR